MTIKNIIYLLVFMSIEYSVQSQKMHQIQINLGSGLSDSRLEDNKAAQPDPYLNATSENRKNQQGKSNLIGLFYSKSLTKRFELRSGVQLSKIGTQKINENFDFYSRYPTSIGYLQKKIDIYSIKALGIPLGIVWKAKETTRWSWPITLGIRGDYYLNYTIKRIFIGNLGKNLDYLIVKPEPYRNWNFRLYGNIGTCYKATEHVAFNLYMHCERSLHSDLRSDRIFKQSWQSILLVSGIAYKW